MARRTTVIPLLIYLLFTWGCAKSTLSKQHLTAVQLEKLESVKVFIKAKDLDESSYKVIQKIQGRSCGLNEAIQNISMGPFPFSSNYRMDEVIEQVKVQAMGAGGNAITNLVCVFDDIEDLFGHQKYCIECEADAIQVD
jgi:hypothetical protein